MIKAIAISVWGLLAVFPAPGWAQKTDKYYGEAYAFYGRRNSQPGTSVGGGGGDVLVYRGIGVGGDIVTTLANPDDKVTIYSVGGSYHFLCCRYKRKFEPFAGAGYSYLSGDINHHGRDYPWDPGNDRTGPYFNQGFIAWPLKHLGVRVELREYRMFVSYGALENVIPGGHVIEVRIGPTLR